MRCPIKTGRANTVIDNAANLLRFVAQLLQRRGNRLIDNLKITTAGKFFILHQCIIGFDSGGIAVHQQTDGSRGSDTGGLCIAKTVFFALFQGIIPSFFRCRQHVVGAKFRMNPLRKNRQPLELLRVGVQNSPAVVAHNPQHVFFVLRIHREWTKLRSKLGGRSIGYAGQKGGNRSGNRPALIGIIRNTHHHE